MSRAGGLGILWLAVLGFACGETSQNEPQGPSNTSGTGGGSKAGAPGGEGTGGKGSSVGGTAGGDPGETGGKGSSAGGGGAGGAWEPALSGVDLQGSPLYTRVQRLTNSQWENAVTDVLRFSQRQELAAKFAPPLLGAVFNNNEKVLFVDSRNFVDFEAGAEAAAAIATGSAEALGALYADSGVTGFVRELGRRAFRRPLTPEEETKYQSIFARGEQLYGSGFANGAALVIRGLLQSPHFLYRTELGPSGEPLNPYELASKLSFWLLGTTPSDALLDDAAAGALASSDGLEAAARQMLDDPRAEAMMRDFHGQLLHFDALQSIEKVGVPEIDPATNSELALASSAFFDLVFRENLGVREILTSSQAYVGPRLAPFYGLDPPANGLELRELGPSRSGYFMQVPFLMLGGYSVESEPIRRGYQLEATLLCVPPHPQDHPSVLSLPLPQQGESTRQRVSQLTEPCGTCHSVYIDPLGFAFENFDGLGRERELDNGQPVDTTGSYPFAEGIENFADGNELMKIMAKSTQVHTCYSKQLTIYALGRDLVERDRPLLQSLAKVSLSASLKEMAVALVRDPAFRTREAGQP